MVSRHSLLAAPAVSPAIRFLLASRTPSTNCNRGSRQCLYAGIARRSSLIRSFTEMPCEPTSSRPAHKGPRRFREHRFVLSTNADKCAVSPRLYSHLTYKVLPDGNLATDRPKILIFEGMVSSFRTILKSPKEQLRSPRPRAYLILKIGARTTFSKESSSGNFIRLSWGSRNTLSVVTLKAPATNSMPAAIPTPYP